MKIELSCLLQETDNSCLPACIRIVLRYPGHDLAESAICAACETTDSGTEDEYISFIDPARGEEVEIAIETFLAAWDERGRLGLVIEPW